MISWPGNLFTSGKCFFDKSVLVFSSGSAYDAFLSPVKNNSLCVEKEQQNFPQDKGLGMILSKEQNQCYFLCFSIHYENREIYHIMKFYLFTVMFLWQLILGMQAISTIK